MPACWRTLTDRQQTWFNFSQGFEIRIGQILRQRHLRVERRPLPVAEERQRRRFQAGRHQVNAYELGWRYTGDNLRTQIAAYYSLSDKSIAINKTDMTINVNADKRRIYGVEGAVDYFF